MAKTTWPIIPSYGAGSDEGFIRDDCNGTVYTGEGCWGAPTRPNNDDKAWTRNSGSFNQFKWIFVDQNNIEFRTIQVDNANSVGQVSDNNIFQPPANLDIWNPSNGSVVIISGSPGTACNDNNDCTVNDTYNSNCQCVGIFQDSDNDGVCTNVDCNDNDASIPTTPGTTCNDNDPNTTNDVIQADECTCAGTPTDGYCASQGNNTQYEFIQSVNFSGINNTSGDNGGYADYSGQTATVNKGSSYNITLTPGFASGAYTEYWKVWIDFNQDGDFDVKYCHSFISNKRLNRNENQYEIRCCTYKL